MVYIYDTTLRDGAQTKGVSFSLEDKLRITQALDELGVHYIEGGWPGSNPKDLAYFEAVKGLRLGNSKVVAFSSTRRKGLKVEEDPNIQQLVKTEVPAVTVFGKSWDLHATQALGISLEENLQLIYDTISYLKRYFEEVFFDAEHFFDGYKSNPEYAVKTLKVAEEAGADCLVLCDTNGGTLWFETEEIFDAVLKEVKAPLGIHAHNDADMAVVNSLIAVRKGAVQVQGTINGLGERTGNANLCSIIPNLVLKMGVESIPKENLKKLYKVSRLVSELSNRPHPANLPFVGENAFAHKAGVHVSAVEKNPKLYEHMEPELVGNRRKITVSELSGRSNIVNKAREFGVELEKGSPEVKKVLERVKELEAQGYHFEGAEGTLELLFKESVGKAKKYFELKGFRVLTEKRSDNDEAYAEATIKVEIPEEVAREKGLEERVEHTAAEGRGPVEALDKALRKALEKFYPELKSVKLTDYKVRILNEAAGTKALPRVLIESTDGESKWGTVGVSPNIIEASWLALADAFKYKLMKEEEKKRR
ncbi:citramalate synthase [Thermovibrio ammonificans]|jgi:2-isopropylmalate synthase|uniref:Citramalate synthase n=1 Tax=Thermovibrio ammonificans (strain DSM 15698 / JCM 12110 / HB-1) TaxID=648996 RepID=E8T4T4_THEA1|nr:citramalate synthase [Thermovibrio ammonificans]ADU96346.1 2-isopropylmalate synthase/homocitrate synthase family protein [Thermovibrio ammonificans HB-1]